MKQLQLLIPQGSGGYPVPAVDNSKVLCVKYVSGSIAAQRADLVVGRGGHDLFWTAIMAGKPFFGAPPNSEWLDYCKCAQLLGVGDYIEEKSFSGAKVISSKVTNYR